MIIVKFKEWRQNSLIIVGNWIELDASHRNRGNGTNLGLIQGASDEMYLWLAQVIDAGHRDQEVCNVVGPTTDEHCHKWCYASKFDIREKDAAMTASNSLAVHYILWVYRHAR